MTIKVSEATARGLATLLCTRSSVADKARDALKVCRFVSHRNIIVDLCDKYWDVPDIIETLDESFNLAGLFRIHKELEFDESTDDIARVVTMVFKGIDSLLPTSSNMTTDSKGEFHLNMTLVFLFGYKRLSFDLLIEWMVQILQFVSWKYQLTEFPDTFFSKKTVRTSYFKSVQDISETFAGLTCSETLAEKIAELCDLSSAGPMVQRAIQCFFGPEKTSVSDADLRLLAHFPVAFLAFHKACTVRPTLQIVAEKRQRVSRGSGGAGSTAVTVSTGVQFPAVKVMRKTKFREMFSNAALPYVSSSEGSFELDLHRTAQETFDFMMATCSSDFFKNVDPMCCALIIKPGYGRCHLLASNAELNRSNASLKYDDPAHPNTFFIQLLGCYPAFVVMANDTVRFYLAPAAIVKELRNSSGRIDPDLSGYRPPFFDGWESDFSCRQGAGLAGLHMLMADVMAHVAVVSIMIEGDTLTEESSCKIQSGPGVKAFWIAKFLSFYRQAFGRLKAEVEMMPKEAFQVTAAFLSCPTPDSFSPDAFKQAVMGNLIALTDCTPSSALPLAPPLLLTNGENSLEEDGNSGVEAMDTTPSSGKIAVFDFFESDDEGLLAFTLEAAARRLEKQSTPESTPDL